MSAMLPICDDVLGALDGAVAWLQFVSDAINAGNLVIPPNATALGIAELRSELASLQDVALPVLRNTAARSREHLQRHAQPCR